MQMGAQPPWFKVLVLMEVFLQLPFFFVGAYAFAARREWIRIPALVYGINVASTMVNASRVVGTFYRRVRVSGSKDICVGFKGFV